MFGFLHSGTLVLTRGAVRRSVCAAAPGRWSPAVDASCLAEGRGRVRMATQKQQPEAAVEAVTAEAEDRPESLDDMLACPSCRAPITANDTECGECHQKFNKRPNGARYADLTLSAGQGSAEGYRPKQDIFRSPVVSFLYERGWRQQFRAAGFPGPDAEFVLAQNYFKEASGGSVLDMSCGSGLITRRLVRSGLYRKVVACDFSESMLTEVERRRVEEGVAAFDMVRGDVARLPFKSDSFDAVHSGAALHCWPKVQDGAREIHRVVKPGGLFFATTFLWGSRRSAGIENRGVPYRFFDPEELEWIMKGAGFNEVSVEKLQRCAVIRCRK